jgi:hypothetical protein
MDVLKLATDCAEAMETEGTITLQIPKGSIPKIWPKGELLAERRDEKGRTIGVYRFDAGAILAFLVREGLIDVSYSGEEMIIRLGEALR